MLDKEDNVMSYICLFPNRSYIVMDPLTCDACFHLILAKIMHQVGILLVLSNTLNPVLP